MKMSAPDGVEIMEVNAIEISGNDLRMDVLVLGSMPMKVLLTPREARQAFKLLNFKKIIFILTFLLRK